MITASPNLKVEDIEIKHRPMPNWQRKANEKKSSTLGLEARNAVSITLANPDEKVDLKGQVFSDVHLYLPSKLLNSEYRQVKIGKKDFPLKDGIDPTRFPISLVLQKLNKMPPAEQPDILFFNGDTFEILGACVADGFIPIAANGELVNREKIIATFTKILEENSVFVDELQKYLKNKPNAKIVFNVGNHDDLLVKVGELRDLLHQKLLQNSTDSKDNRLVFCNMAKCPELKLYLEHGHLVEDQSHSKYGAATMCDAMTLACEIIPRAVIKEIERYEVEASANKSFIKNPDLLEKFKKIVRILKNRIENFIFLADVPPIKKYLKFCFDKTKKTLNKKYQNGETGKFAEILEEQIFAKLGNILRKEGIINFYHQIFADSDMKKWIAWAMGYTEDGLEEKLNTKKFQDEFLEQVHEKREEKGDNKIQARAALAIKKLFPKLEFFAFGHTHKKNKNHKGDIYSSKNQKHTIRHFNTGLGHRNITSTQKSDGSWKFTQQNHNGSSLVVERKNGKVTARTHSYDELLKQAV